jgi:hypothetical protein
MANFATLQQQMIEIAKEGDAAWFEAHPESRIRMRNAVAMEFNEPLGEPPLGMSWRALVVEAQPGVRARQPVALPVGTPNDSLDEQALLQLFVQAAPPEAKGVIERLRRIRVPGTPKPEAG